MSTMKPSIKIYNRLAALTNDLFAAQQGRGANLPALYHPHFTAENVAQISPYSVETHVGSIPYAEAYQSLLQNVISTCRSLTEYHESIGDITGVTFFNACVETCQSNDRDLLETMRLTLYGKADTSVALCPSRGPIESYNDLLRHRKKIFEFSLMTIDRTTTTSIQQTIDCHLPEFLTDSGYFDTADTESLLPPSVTTLAGDLTMTGGDFVQIQPSGRSRPTSPDILMKAGSIKQLFLNQLHNKTTRLFVPLAQKLFQTDHHVVLELFQTTPRLHVVLHEHGHTLGKFPDYPTRAGRWYTMIEEIRADMMAIALSLYLEKNNHLKPGTNSALIGAMLVAELYMRSRFDQSKTTIKERESYSRNAPALLRIFTPMFRINGTTLVLKPCDRELIEGLFTSHFHELQHLIRHGQEHDFEAFLHMLEQQWRQEQSERKIVYKKYFGVYLT